VIWSDWRRFCFIHIPKTGGTAISAGYNRHLPFGDTPLGGSRLGESLQAAYRERFGLHKHSTAADVIRVVGIERFRAQFSFAVLRDPLDRLASAWRWALKVQDDTARIVAIARESEGFDGFARQAAAVFRPQADYVLLGEEVVVTRLVPYEALDAAWPGICEAIGLRFDLPRANVSPALPVSASPATEALVREAYARDYALIAALRERAR
jgi:hypothetical protein